MLAIFENSPTFQKVGATLGKEPLKFCENEIFGSDAYWECYVRTSTMTIYHPCCTSPMGKRQNDTRAVIDSNFRYSDLKFRRMQIIS